MTKTKIRSPFFYVGDKYKLMPELIKLFPTNINDYYEPFLGGGSSFLRVSAKNYFLNDIDSNIVRLHRFISSFAFKKEKLLNELINTIKDYGLSCSYIGIEAPKELKNLYKKTYYAKHNKLAYMKLRDDFNANNDEKRLYLLLIYGFNHMLRFNKNNEFNLPVGNVDFNTNVVNALEYYLDFIQNKTINFFNKDYVLFLKDCEFKKNDFVYFDPPYLISSSEYNKLWSLNNENRLYEILDKLNDMGVCFGLSNLVYHKGKHNDLLSNWMKKYNVFSIKSNYISRFDNSIKNSIEVYVTNYEKKTRS